MPAVPSTVATIVIGSGISGLFVALEARHLGPVLVLTKGSIDDCNTAWAQGGIAAAVGPLDSPDAHLEDTIVAGAGLVDRAAAEVLTREAPARIRDLVDYGVRFDSLSGETALGREAAHRHARILHAGGDRTGAIIETALSELLNQPSITVLDHALVTSLRIEAGRVVGVDALDLSTASRESYFAERVVLATGGAGRLFSHTTNPDVATGDGIALAFQAGAELMDLEFYQFHPTALRLDGQPPFLISEAVRGEGAVLRGADGHRFMPRYHREAELAPRDVVARAIVTEMEASKLDHALLDCTAIDGVNVATRFPGIYQFCKEAGIDMARQPIPVAPAAHYFMGGVRTDVDGRTTVPGLYAVGEVACTGVHGANRLASNSLMETVVFGKRAVESFDSDRQAAPASQVRTETHPPQGGGLPRDQLQRLMWAAAGIVRDGPGLTAALAALAGGGEATAAHDRASWEAQQMGQVARLIIQAALAREESRGAHYRSDFPDRDDERWQRHQVYVRAD